MVGNGVLARVGLPDLFPSVLAEFMPAGTVCEVSEWQLEPTTGANQCLR